MSNPDTNLRQTEFAIYEGEKDPLQELRELGYDVIADEIAEGLEKWYDSFASRRPTLAEGYLKGQFGLHVHIKARIEGQSSPAQKHCIFYQVKFRRDVDVAIPGTVDEFRRQADARLVSDSGDGSTDCKVRCLLIRFNSWICQSGCVR